MRPLIFLGFLFITLKIYSILPKDSSNNKLKYLVIPTLFKTPEVGVAFGVSGSFAFKPGKIIDTLTRTSIVQFIGFATTHRQNVQALDASIYFPKENYIFLCQLSHSFFPDRFWGIGPHTKDMAIEHYVFEQFYFYPHLKKKIYNHLWAGVLYELQSVYKINYDKRGSFDTSNFSGKKPYLSSGVGISLSYDTRNSTFWPTKGTYILSQVTENRKEIFSNFDVFKWLIDVRYFKKIFNTKHVLAAQFYNYDTYGQTPLRELAAIGGPNNMRGFYQGRYRANSMMSVITELRLNLIGRFSAVIFGSMGNVYNHYTEIRLNDFKYAYGGGLRFSILKKEKLNIRVDYGYSNRFNKGLYITFGECF